MAKKPTRSADSQQDLGAIPAIRYNDAAGADKIIIVEPVVVKAVAAVDIVGSGKYVKITGNTYTLDLKGRAYDPTKTYQKGDVVTETTDIYLCLEDRVTGTFDASKWRKVAPKTVGPVAITAGSVVCTGRWHNAVSVAGFLVDDSSQIKHTSIRD